MDEKRTGERMFACLLRRNPAWRPSGPDIEKADADDKGRQTWQLGWTDEKGRERLLWREIDIVFRVLYPALFVLFNIIFWPALFLRAF
jgi:hypothetical protein